jgi:hypothetical protein
MTNGFSVASGDLPADARAVARAAVRLRSMSLPPRTDAGRSTDEVRAAIEQLLAEAAARGDGLTALGSALGDAARAYDAADDAVAASLLRWGP